MNFDFMGPKPLRSTAAFLWMPQFRLSFQHMEHIVPVFVRTLAMVFVQSGLLPRNHPALLYGQAGVRKYGVGQVIGEAWFTLRTTRATVSQWGIFTGVMLMMAMTLGSVVTFMMTIAFGASSAQAQIFSHPLGDSSLGGGNTYQPQGAFDTGVPELGAAGSGGDYGLMMLDKVLRAGASGEGIAIQNATRALMQVYNSGVLIIASVIIFWMILSIVVDTAKTGQVGGGRHNMVWVPIRIVFALALLIPLGSTGYSSGQFMVMKVAEWGSNFGTNAWVAYVEGVLDSENLIAPSAPYSVADTVVAYQRLWVCQVAYNSNIDLGGNVDPNSVVGQIERRSIARRTIAFTNRTHSDICGSMTYEEFAAADIPDAARVVGFVMNPANIASSDPMLNNIMTFKSHMRQHYYREMINLNSEFQRIACGYVGGFSNYSGRSVAGCPTAWVGNGNKPSADDLHALVERYGSAIQRHFDSEVRELSRDANGDSLLQYVEQRGWAGMGMWYHRISQLNSAVGSVQQASLTIAGPGVMDIENGAKAIEDTKDMIKAFNEWWDLSVIDAVSAPVNVNTGQAPATEVAPTERQGQRQGLLGWVKSLTDPGKIMDAVSDRLGVFTNTWLITLLDASDDATSLSFNTYPMALLAQTGGNIFWTGSLLFGGSAAIQIGLGAIPTLTLATSIIFPLVGKLGLTLMVAGLMLKFYIPIIPFVRTSFSILTWIISVFEAVALVPIAALAHLTSEGEGLSGGAGHVWKLWLNILLRPIMTVIGFVGAMLVYNGFISYFHSSFIEALAVGLPTAGFLGLLSGIVYAVIYVFIMYTVANSVFKMLDLIPNALTRWIGGQQDMSFDNENDRGIMYAAANMINGVNTNFMPKDKKEEGNQDGENGQKSGVKLTTP